MWRSPLFVVVLVIAGGIAVPGAEGAQSTASDPATVCEANELAAFSCDLSDRQVALCVSTATNKMPEALHFRFRDSHGGKVTAFPTKEDEQSAFVESGTWFEGAGNPGRYIAITSGKKRYSAYATGARGAQYGNFSGVLIEQKSLKPSDNSCNQDDTDFDGPGAVALEKIEQSPGLDGGE